MTKEVENHFHGDLQRAVVASPGLTCAATTEKKVSRWDGLPDVRAGGSASFIHKKRPHADSLISQL
jgi:hypothetical protein